MIEELFDYNYTKELNSANVWLKFDESKISVQSDGHFQLSKDEVIALGIGLLWVKYGQEIADHIRKH